MEATFDFAALTVGGVSIALLTFGIVETFKLFGVKDWGTRVVALGVALVLTAVTLAIEQGLMPAAAIPWIKLAIGTLAGAVSAMGFYGFVDKRTVRRDE